MSKPDPGVVKRNAVVLSNAVAVASAIVSQLGDKNISRTLNNESLTRAKLEQLVGMKLTRALAG